MNFGDMSAQVQVNLGLQDIAVYDEVGYIKNQINAGVVDLLSRTRCTVRCIDMHVDAGISQYKLDQAILALVDLEDGLLRVDRTSNYRPSFTLIRSDILRIQPTPTEAAELQVWAVKRPSPMVADADSPSMEQFGAVPGEYHDAIVGYALWHAGDYADDSTSQHGERFRILYEGQDGRGGRLGQIRMLVNKRGTARAPNRRVRGLRPVASINNWVG